jgi:ABC-type multidrug transport system ATPase subunit
MDVDQASPALMDVAALTKRYGEQFALADVAFDIHGGEVLGIIGPNGAGKTTLLEGLAGLLPVDSGDVRWQGRTLPRAQRRNTIFYLPDGLRPYQDQYVARILAFFAGAYGSPRAQVAGAIERLALAPVLQKRVRALSKGFGRRLMLALGLIAPQPVLIMDEPFDGFDLRQTRDVVHMLRELAASGRTLVFAIHQLADAERACDRFLLLAEGRVLAHGTLGELRNRTAQPRASLEDVFLALT